MAELDENKYVFRNPEDLIPYAKNSRKHSESQVNQLAASIKEFGFKGAILIEPNDTIIAGHGRVLAAMKAGLTRIPCIIESDLSERQLRAYRIVDNSIALNSEWDVDLLKIEVEEIIEDGDTDLDLLGFEDDFLEDLLKDDPDSGGGITGDLPHDDPDVEYSNELELNDNYVVLVFKDREKFEQACNRFKIKREKRNESASGNQMYLKYGLGRVVYGDDLIGEAND